MKKYLFLIIYTILILIGEIHPQTTYLDILRNEITNLLMQRQDGNYKLGLNMIDSFIDVDSVIAGVYPDYTDFLISDQYSTLRGCVLFLAIDTSSQLYNPVGHIGIYRANQIVWLSEGIVDFSGGRFLGSLDLNKDGTTEIITACNSGINGTYEQIWIYSWDGTIGRIVSKFDEAGYSLSTFINRSCEIFDINGDNIYEIIGTDKIINDVGDESEITKVLSWNERGFGFWADTPVYNPNTYSVANNINAIIYVQVNRFQDSLIFDYSVKSDSNSSQSISYIFLTSTLKKSEFDFFTPIGWGFYSEIAPLVYFEAQEKKYSVANNSTLQGFKLKTNALPVIDLVYLQAAHLRPDFPIEEYLQHYSDHLNDIYTNSLKIFTICPTLPPDSLVSQDFLDSLILYTQRSFLLGWISDSLTANKYNNLFNSAKIQLQQNNNNGARATLHTMLQQVDIDSTSQLTSEAYALLRYNTEYLLEKIPESSPNLIVNLKNSLGNQLLPSNVTYYEGSWKDAVNNGDGTFTVITTKPTVSIRVFYEYASLQANNISAHNNSYTFTTVNTAVQLKNSIGNLIDQGSVQYYAGAWRTFGTTSNGVAYKELLPINYSFRMTYEYGSIDKQQNLSTDPTVVFQTLNAAVQLKNSIGNLIDQGSVQYYAGAWRTFGTTSNGVAYKELLPINYSFRMTYEYGSIDKQQNLSSDPTVVFQTVNAAVQLKNSLGNLIDQGTVQYYAGAWRTFGTTSNGVAYKDLLPINYSFRMTYEYVSKDKQQNLSTNPVVDFNTVLCSIKVSKTSNNQPINNATVKYYAGAWRNLGTTNIDGVTTKELIPANISFRATYGNVSLDKQQDISVNNMIDIFLNVP